MKTKNKIIKLIILIIISIVITKIFSVILFVDSFKYQLVLFLVFIVLIIVFFKKNWFYRPSKYIKCIFILFVFSTICLPLCIDTFLYKPTYLIINPLGEKSEKSSEMWIYNITVNGKKIDFNKISNYAWKKNADYLVYSNNENVPLKIRIRNKIDEIVIEFSKASNLDKNFEINGVIYNTYSDVWKMETIHINNIEREKENIIKTILYIVYYYIISIVLAIIFMPILKKKKYNYLIPVLLIYLYTIHYYNLIFSISILLFVIVAYCLLRNWSVVNEKNN